MNITLDGCSGAGKTTQAIILEKKLNLKRIMLYVPSEAIKSMVRALQSYPKPENKYQVVNTLTFMLTLGLFYPKSEIGSIIEHYWEYLLPFTSRKGGEVNISDNTQAAIDFFHRCLELFENPIPDVSIYIDGHSTTQKERKWNSEYGNTATLNQEVIAAKVNWQPFFKSLEEMIPYFHIVDGNQSIEKVTESIIELLP